MAERLPGGATKNSRITSLSSFSTSPTSSDASAAIDRMVGSIAASCVADSNGSNGLPVSDAQITVSRLPHSEVVRNGTKQTEADVNHEAEWVEQDEPGVYITLTALPDGIKDLKRVRFRYYSHQHG